MSVMFRIIHNVKKLHGETDNDTKMLLSEFSFMSFLSNTTTI